MPSVSPSDDPARVAKRPGPASSRADGTAVRERRSGEPIDDTAGNRRGEVAVAGLKLAAVTRDERAVEGLAATGPRSTQGDIRVLATQTARPETAVAAPGTSQSTPTGGSGADGGDDRADASLQDEPDFHLHIDPTPRQVAVFLGVFLTGLATALAMTSTRSAGAHRRH